MTHDPREVPQITMADIRKHTGEGMVSEQSVIDAANEVLKEIYTSPPPAAGWDITDDMVRNGAQAMADSDTADGPSYESLARACLEAALRREAAAPDGVAVADWSELPKDIYVIGAQRVNAVGFDVQCCSVPMVTVPEVRYVRADMITSAPSRPDAGGGVRDQIAALAHRFWSIHPSVIAAKNLTREEFYAREMTALFAALSTPPAAAESNASVEARLRGGSMAAQWTYDPEAEAYYFAPMTAAPGPYMKQRHVDAIIDIASDGTLAGVELIDNMPPPPVKALSAVGDEAKKSEGIQSAYGEYTPITVRASTTPSSPTDDRREIVALADIAAERKRQIEAEGWTVWHDDRHTDGALAKAATCYASVYPLAASYWPWDIKWWKPKDRRRDLVRAGALIVAEIERLDRLAALDGGAGA